MAMISAQARVRLGPQGRLVIPVELRKALGLHPGDTLIARVEANRLVIESYEALVNSIQALFAHVPSDVSLVDELIHERREEARREAVG